MTKVTNKNIAEKRHYFKIIRENIEEIKSCHHLKDKSTIESCMRWCAWVHNDCKKLLKLKEVTQEGKEDD